MTDKTGGAAFPMIDSVYSDEWEIKQGMTLRDYFAAKAMAADLSRDKSICEIFSEYDKPNPMDDAAEVYYKMADAMLKAREN